MQDLAGRTIKSYKIGDLIGMGAFGSVYRAHQAVIEREVAIKIIYPAFANHPNFIRRFESEAQLVAGLEHPHIVPLYDYWREPDGAYIVMRWLRGGALRSLMNKPWSLEDTSRVLAQVAAALTLAHRSGVVHRDIKPENILLDDEANAYLADFGIAQILSVTHDEDDDMGSMGSPAYAAPEQILGTNIDIQTDVFSFALVIYELLAGRHPFPNLADLTETQLLHVRTTKPLPSILELRPDIPPKIDAVLHHATAFEPLDRYPDAISFAREFRGAMFGKTYVSAVSPLRITALDSEIVPNPYKGLRAFQESDSQHFFGREELAHRLLDRLTENHPFNHFLAVVGPSGSGKSSAVKAGLMPLLRRGRIRGSEDWFYSEIVPGNQPFDELETELLSLASNPPDNFSALLRRDKNGFLEATRQILPPNGQLLLFIDQFEEVFTLADTLSDAFLDSLYAAVSVPNSPIRIIITLRADFYDRPLKRPQISELMRERTEVVVPLNAQELEEAIIRPAQQVGLSLDPTLVTAIIAEVNEQAGALPLLQYALSELFSYRTSNLITYEAYQKLGGVKGALAQRADDLYLQFDPAHQEAIRQLFLRLVTLGEGTEDTRRRALLSEVTSLRSQHDSFILRTVIDALGKSRLLTFDRDPFTRAPTVEVAHEAIIREWSRLRNWLDESRNDVRMQRALALLASEWQNNKGDVSYLLRGIRLEQYERWALSTNVALTADERDYLNASIHEAARMQAHEVARQEREKQLEQRSVNRLRLLVGVLLAAFIGAVLLSGFALNQSNTAQSERDRAESALAFSISTTQGVRASQAERDFDSDLAVVLALAANSYSQPSVESRRVLAEVALGPGTRHLMRKHTSFVYGVDISSDGQWIVSGGSDAKVMLWDVQTGDLIRVFEGGHNGDVQSVTFSPNGQQVVSTGLDYKVILWDSNTGQEIRRFEGHKDSVTSSAFSPDGQYLLTGSADNLILVWNVATGELIRTFGEHTVRVRSINVSADSRYVLSSDRIGIFWDLATGEVIHRLELDTPVRTAALSADGKMALTGSTDGSLYMWDLTTGQILHEYDEDRVLEIETLDFNPNGKNFAVGTANGFIDIFNVATGEVQEVLAAHTDGILSVVYNPFGTQLVSGSKDFSVRLWQLDNPSLLHSWQIESERITDLASDAVENRMYAMTSQQVLVSDGQSGAWSTLIELPDLAQIALKPDGSQLWIGTETGGLAAYEAVSGALLDVMIESGAGIRELVFSPDGVWVASSDGQGTVIIWEAASGTELGRHEFSSVRAMDFTEHHLVVADGETLLSWDLGADVQTLGESSTDILDLAISPDGKRVLTGGRDGVLNIWNLEIRQRGATLLGHTETIFNVAFSPDGSVMASSGSDGLIILWDTSQEGEIQRFISNAVPYALTFGASAERVWTGTALGNVDEWRYFRLDDLLQWTCDNRYIHPLTEGEREFYGITHIPCA